MKKMIFSILILVSINANAVCNNDSIPYNSSYTMKYSGIGLSGSGNAKFYGWIHTSIYNFYKMYYIGTHNGVKLESPYNTTYTIDKTCTLRFSFYRKSPLKTITIVVKPRTGITTMSALYGTITEGTKSAPISLIRK